MIEKLFPFLTTTLYVFCTHRTNVRRTPDPVTAVGSASRCKIAANMCRVVRKPAFCICENKDADQLRGNREADQRLCFRYIDSTISLLPKYEISML